MPPKRRKFESTFPAARIKKIMQLDDDVGRVASSVPVVISRAVEVFLHAVLTRSCDHAASRSAKTLSVAHIKHCIDQEKQWDFLKDITSKIPDMAAKEEEGGEGAPRRGRKRRTSQSEIPPSSSTSGRKKKHKMADGAVTTKTDSETPSPAVLDCLPSVASASAGLLLLRNSAPVGGAAASPLSAQSGSVQLDNGACVKVGGAAGVEGGSGIRVPLVHGAGVLSSGMGVALGGGVGVALGGGVGLQDLKAASEDANTLASLAALTSGLQRTTNQEEEEDYDV